MNNIDTVKGFLRHMITPENPTHVEDIAEALADAGLLMPDLPEPDEEGRFWVGDRPLWISWEGQPCIEARGLGGFAVLEGATVPLGEIGEARAVALALLAASEKSEKLSLNNPKGSTNDQPY